MACFRFNMAASNNVNVTYICSNYLEFYTAYHQVLTYIEYRAVSSVFRNIDPHTLSNQRVCPPLAPQGGGGGTNSPGGEGGGVVNISEDGRHWIGLLQYNPSTLLIITNS
jgi:hypothetical protein